jgi:hypothetical protein
MWRLSDLNESSSCTTACGIIADLNRHLIARTTCGINHCRLESSSQSLAFGPTYQKAPCQVATHLVHETFIKTKDGKIQEAQDYSTRGSTDSKVFIGWLIWKITFLSYCPGKIGKR